MMDAFISAKFPISIVLFITFYVVNLIWRYGTNSDIHFVLCIGLLRSLRVCFISWVYRNARSLIVDFQRIVSLNLQVRIDDIKVTSTGSVIEQMPLERLRLGHTPDSHKVTKSGSE